MAGWMWKSFDEADAIILVHSKGAYEKDRLLVGALRAHLHQASTATLRQLCDDACDSVIIEINGDA